MPQEIIELEKVELQELKKEVQTLSEELKEKKEIKRPSLGFYRKRFNR